MQITNNLKADGYDGVHYNGNLNQEYVAFSPNQIKIKSATENIGKFSLENNDIRYQQELNISSLEAQYGVYNSESLFSASNLASLRKEQRALL